MAGTGAEGEEAFAQAAKLLELKPPADEYRALVRARIEVTARLEADSDEGASTKLDDLRAALDLGLKRIREARS